MLRLLSRSDLSSAAALGSPAPAHRAQRYQHRCTARLASTPLPIRSDAATNPLRPIPCLQCTTTLRRCRINSASSFARNPENCASEEGTPRSGIGRPVKPHLMRVGPGLLVDQIEIKILRHPLAETRSAIDAIRGSRRPFHRQANRLRAGGQQSLVSRPRAVDPIKPSADHRDTPLLCRTRKCGKS